MNSNINTQLCVVGGGPAGLMVGLLFSRAGVDTLVLEKHGDFLRDFRGDTVHPSTLELFHELGWLDEVLALPHDRVPTVAGRIAGRRMRIADFRHLRVAAPYIALLPQWELLNLVARKAETYPNFTLAMNSEATGVTEDDMGRVSGVRLSGGGTVTADLVIAADGRRSVLRDDAQLPLQVIGAPMDIFWFKLPKAARDTNQTFGIFERGRILVLIDRGDYWQCAFAFGKDGAEAVKARGLDAFKAELAQRAPEIASELDALASWDQVSFLSVALDRLTRWHRPGLLAIGDAAHAMSPIGGVGINLAVQDAVAAANVLAGPMAGRTPVDSLLAKVQKRRWRATRWMQGLQNQAQQRLIAPLLSNEAKLEKPPAIIRMIDRVPLLQRIPARVIGLGFGRQHIESPNAFEG